MLIDAANFERCFKGYTIVDCAIRNKNIFYFVTLGDYDEDDVPPADSERRTRVVICFLDEPIDKRWKLITFEGFDGLLGSAIQVPKSQFVGVDQGGQVISFGSGEKEHETPIAHDRNGPLRGGVRRLRTINGQLYIASGYRGLARRIKNNEWESLCSEVEFEFSPESIPSEYGHDDVDGFPSGELYCVGGKGDVWKRNIQGIWQRCKFPAKSMLESVCCAGDGFVYIGAENGALWKGKEDEWKLLSHGGLSMPFHDLVWFANRLYCGNEIGLWMVDDEKVISSDVPEGIVGAGRVASADGVMLIAGIYGVSYHDGSKWIKIFNASDFM